MEGHPDLVPCSKRRESLSELVIPLGGDRVTAEGFSDLGIEVDIVVGLAGRKRVDMDVDAGSVVHFSQLFALDELRLAHLGSVGIDRRGLGIVALLTSTGSTGDA